MSVIDFPSAGTLGQNLQPKRIDLVMYRGDSYDFEFQLNNESAQGIDLSGMDGVVHVKSGLETESVPIDPDPEVVLNAGDVDGKVVVTFSSELTDQYGDLPNYKKDSLIWELQISGGSPLKVRTYLGGKISMFEDIVTNA